MDHQLLLSLVIGLCLSAACGLKVFVPPLAMGLANKAGLLSLSEQTEWIGTWPAIFVFLFAVVFEFIGFCIPVFGNLLDVIATPAAIAVGVLAMFSQLEQLSPVLKWTFAIVGGGLTSGAVQVATATVRAGGSAVTLGFSNALFALFELVTAMIVSLMTLLAPVICLAMVVLLMVGLFWGLLRVTRAAKTQS